MIKRQSRQIVQSQPSTEIRCNGNGKILSQGDQEKSSKIQLQVEMKSEYQSKLASMYLAPSKSYKKQWIKCIIIFIILLAIILVGVSLSDFDSLQQIQTSSPLTNNQPRLQNNVNQNNQTPTVIKPQSEQKAIVDSQNNNPIKIKPNSTNSYVFQVQKKYWLFHAERHDDYLKQLYYQNNKYFAGISGFQVNIVTLDNYGTFLTSQAKVKLDSLIKTLKSQKDIIRKAIMLYILKENGGVMMSQYYALTQPLDWIRDLQNNIYAKRGKRTIIPQVFTYFDPYLSPPPKKQNIETDNEADKYMRALPHLDSYFIVAKKKCNFMVDLLQQIAIQSLRQQSTNIDSFFSRAATIILEKKQQMLDSSQKQSQYRKLALHQYGLFVMNNLSGPRKIWALWDSNQPHSYFQTFARQTHNQIKESMGGFPYVMKFEPHNTINNYLVQIKSGVGRPIIKQSFVQKIFYPTAQQTFVIENPQKHFVNETSQPWTALPKIIWVYWNSGIENAPLDNQLCVENLKKRGKQSGFELRVVSQSTVGEYLEKQTLDKIQTAIRTAGLTTFPQSKPDLYRLALLIKYGGVYLDVSYVAFTNFDWLVNIGRYRSQFIYNRYGHLPKVLFFWHPQWCGKFDWTVNTKLNTKVQWHLSYQNNFIAAEKGSQFISEWFQLLLSFYPQNYGQVNNYFRNQGLTSDLWNSQYLMPMDTIKCVVARRELALKKQQSQIWADATDYYKIWSMSGNIGIQKIRLRMGLQNHNNPDNVDFYRYSQDYVEGMIGNMFHLSKFYGQHNQQMSNFIINNRNNYLSQAHPQSLFMRHLYSKDLQLSTVNGKWILKKY